MIKHKQWVYANFKKHHNRQFVRSFSVLDNGGENKGAQVKTRDKVDMS